MQTVETKNKTYLLDDDGFLINPAQWDKDFAESLAPSLGIPALTTSHWNVLKFIRSTYLETDSCPLVHKTCKVHNLSIKDLQRLFPSGYQRGACKLAGVSFMAEGVCFPLSPTSEIQTRRIPLAKRVYRINVQGFLIDPNEWDEDYAIFKTRELRLLGPLTEKHWQIIRYLRSEFEKQNEIPTVFETCAAVGIDVNELAELFPSGYHRGAVKIAGLNLAAKAHLDAPVVAAPKRL
ncbi:Sulfur relay protein, TusE/DsrC/DsvC family [Syntrophobacter sp. SbD1]|nr:Sulfur relay protein, TusE/DsrC/DsvC family [Syntrophobacter sp. SbD1]